MEKLNFSKMTKEEFLKAAILESAEREMAELEAMDMEIPKPAEEQRKEIKELLDRKFGENKN